MGSKAGKTKPLHGSMSFPSLTFRHKPMVRMLGTFVVVVVVFTLKAVPISTQYLVLSNIRTGPTDANAFLPWSQANYPESVHIMKKIERK